MSESCRQTPYERWRPAWTSSLVSTRVGHASLDEEVVDVAQVHHVLLRQTLAPAPGQQPRQQPGSSQGRLSFCVLEEGEGAAELTRRGVDGGEVRGDDPLELPRGDLGGGARVGERGSEGAEWERERRCGLHRYGKSKFATLGCDDDSPSGSSPTHTTLLSSRSITQHRHVPCAWSTRWQHEANTPLKGFGFQQRTVDSRASPPHRPRGDELTHPADPSRSNLAAALSLLRRLSKPSWSVSSRVESSRASPPPHRPPEDGLAYPSDTSRSNLGSAFEVGLPNSLS